MKVAGSLIQICVLTPIWWFLVYTMLKAIHAGRLAWFLFLIYVPVGFLGAVLLTAAEFKKK